MRGKRLVSSAVASILPIALLASLALAQAPAGTPLGNGFAYQGVLRSSDVPYSGPCDFIFRLYDALSGGTQVGTLTKTNVTVQDGLFTQQLDYGAGLFAGDARWLEIAVRCPAGSGSYTTLSPRQALTAAPAALSLVVPSSVQATSSSALVSVTNSGTGEAVRAASAGHGMVVSQAGWAGLYVASASYDGVEIGAAGDDGVYVGSAGNPSTTYPSASRNGVEVAGAQGKGVYVGQADEDGIYVASAGQRGVWVSSAAATGVHVASAGYCGFWVSSANNDGMHVESVGGDGLNVWSAGDDGLFLASAADDGAEVWADNDGVYANTMQASHEWGVYTPDKIYAGSALASGGPSLIVAQNGDGIPLQPGDVVAVSGSGAPFADGDFPVPQVRRASSPGPALAGVVYARFVAEEKTEQVEHDGQVELQTSIHSRSTEGPVAPGEYLLMVVLGVAQLRASTLSGPISAGDLLTTGAEGLAVPLAASGYVPGTVVGTAMEALDAAPGSSLLWVLVSPR